METYTLKIETLTLSNAMALASLQLNREVARIELADALNITRQYANSIKDKPLTPEQITKIEETLKVNLSSTTSSNSNPTGKIELHYWGKGLPCEEKLKNPLVSSMWFDREIINGGLQKDEHNLSIIAMPGDKMDGGNYPLKNGDILIIDRSQTDISISGVYFFTTENDKEVFVNNFRKTPFGDIVLGFSNPKYEDYEISKEKLKTAKINVVGRVIKNLFLTI